MAELDRLPHVTSEDLDEAQRALYDTFLRGPRQSQASFFPVADSDGVLSGPYRAMLLSPPLGGPLERLGRAVRYESTIPDRTRELAILTVAHLTASAVEWAAHERLAVASGVPERTIAALRGPDPRFEDPFDELTHRFVRQLLVDHRVSNENFATLRANLGPAGVFELVVTVGYYQIIAHVNNGFALGVPAGAEAP